MKKREINMNTLTAWSTFAIAVLTFALVLVAAVNFHKFVQNVKLMADSVQQQSNSIKLQSDSIELQRKDFLLTHKPIIFIKAVLPPMQQEKKNNPFKHAFILTNSGKLPAREVIITVIFNQVIGTNIAIDNTQNIPILHEATIYPNNDLMFWVGQAINLGGIPTKAEAIFTINYKCEGIDQLMQEKMKFIFSDNTSYKWMYVGPNVDIFQKERREVQKRVQELKNRKNK